MPIWTRGAFSGFKQLNIIQSKVYKTALYTPQNILVSAPTGSGKTNIALLAILQIINNNRTADDKINLS